MRRYKSGWFLDRKTCSESNHTARGQFAVAFKCCCSRSVMQFPSMCEMPTCLGNFALLKGNSDYWIEWHKVYLTIWDNSIANYAPGGYRKVTLSDVHCSPTSKGIYRILNEEWLLWRQLTCPVFPTFCLMFFSHAARSTLSPIIPVRESDAISLELQHAK